MKNVLFLFAFVFFANLHAQSSYEAAMGKAFGLFQQEKYVEAGALFERISNTNTEDWIPVYHAANAGIIASFNEQDPTLKNGILEKTKGLIKEAHRRSPNNAEVFAIEGLLYTSYLQMDPQTNGMTMPQLIQELYQKGLKHDPENPRVHLNLIQYKIGEAQYFGQDVSQYCDKMKEIIPKFKNEKEGAPFAPRHGLEQAQYIVDNMCNE